MTSASVGTVLGDTNDSVKAECLILVNLSGTECRTWLTAMREAGQPWYEELVDDLSKAKALLQGQSNAYFLICFDLPEKQVASYIDMNRAPSQALANWMNQTEALLEVYRSHYSRITLVGREVLYNKSKQIVEHVAARSGIALGRVTAEEPQVAPAPEKSNQQRAAMHQLLALQALEHPPAQRLLQELEASSLPLVETTDLFDFIDSSCDILKQVPQEKLEAKDEAYRKLKEKLDDTQQENDLVIEQLHKTQEELEECMMDNQGEHEIEKLKRDIQSKNEKLHNFSQKNKQLTLKLKSVRQDLSNMRSSKSWKITAPLRTCMKLLAGKRGE